MVTWWEDESPNMSALKLSDVIDGVKENPEILDMDDPYDQLYEFDIEYVPMVSAINFYKSNGIEAPDWMYEELDSRNFW